VLGTLYGKVEIREIPSGTRLAEITGHRGSVDAVALAQQGNLLITGCEDGEIRVFDVRSPSDVALRFALKPHRGAISSARIAPDGRWLAAFVRGSREVLLWNLEQLTAEVQQILGKTSPSTSGPLTTTTSEKLEQGM
ncbi:MAG TPA: hypothetical protein VEI07_01550, partial [Planctomycetaceae bacterium]|nr:hypothetical protein [Planctomycetaceae bacterium]